MKAINLNEQLRKKDFYEGVIFEDDKFKDGKKEVKEFMSKWLSNLQKYKKVRIRKFKDLLEPLNEIIFPIEITHVFKGSISLEVCFTDNEGKKYYMIQNTLYDYNKMNTYMIGRRNSQLEPLVDREFTFEISKDKINLIETGVLKLKKDGTNADEAVDFCYNLENNFTEAKIKSYSNDRTIEIHYPTMGTEFDKKVLEFLFDANDSEWYYYNVLPILKWIMPMLDEKATIFIIAKNNNEVCSEIAVIEGIVQKYTRTEIISEAEIHIIKVIFAKDIKEFLAENKV